MLFHNGCKSTKLKIYCTCCTRDIGVFQKIHGWTVASHHTRAHFFAYLVGKCWLFAVHGLEAKNFRAIATRWDKTCACCNSVKGVKAVQLDGSQHGMVGWEVGEQYTLQFKCIMEANDRRPLTGHTFPSARRTRLWVKKTQGDGSYQGHGDWDTDADGHPASGYRSTLPSKPKQLGRFSQSCATAKPEPPKFMALTPKSPPVACTLLRVHSPIPQLQGKHYAQPSTYKNRMAMLCTAEDWH